MTTTRQLAVGMLLLSLAVPLQAADDDKAREQFQDIVDGFNARSFEMVEPFIDKTDLMNRVLSVRAVSGDSREKFSAGFSSLADAGFVSSIHNVSTDDGSEVIGFTFADGKGSGIFRVAMRNYQYAYLIFELRHDRRGRLKIVDWFDSRRGQTYTVTLSEILITQQPRKETTRALLNIGQPTDLQLFQATELLKASRDGQPSRFFEIYDDLDDELKRQPLIAKFAINMATHTKDAQRFVDVLQVFVGLYGEEKDFAAVISDYYLQLQAYQQAFESLQKFHQFVELDEGAMPARLSALALAIGNAEDAEKYALKATIDEPALELAWWSLLRAKAAGGDFAGAVDALTYLEDNFEHRLDASKLRQDPFRAFQRLSASQEFKDWRAGRQ